MLNVEKIPKGTTHLDEVLISKIELDVIEYVDPLFYFFISKNFHEHLHVVDDDDLR
jgi:hypothetical protein